MVTGAEEWPKFSNSVRVVGIDDPAGAVLQASEDYAFEVAGGTSVTIDSVTIANSGAAKAAIQCGGLLQAGAADLAMYNTRISGFADAGVAANVDCSADLVGVIIEGCTGGVLVELGGSVRVEASTIRNNTNGMRCAGIGNLSLVRTTVTDNDAGVLYALAEKIFVGAAGLRRYLRRCGAPSPEKNRTELVLLRPYSFGHFAAACSLPQSDCEANDVGNEHEP